MTETTTPRKRGPESPEARIARADRVAQEMTAAERADLLSMLAGAADPVAACVSQMDTATAARDAAMAKAREDFTAAHARIRRRESVARIFADLSIEYRARLVRLLRSMDGE